jgi:hypothetical protein
MGTLGAELSADEAAEAYAQIDQLATMAGSPAAARPPWWWPAAGRPRR